MAKKGDGEGWALLGFLIAALGLIYLKTGRGEDDSPLIPNTLEGKIDLVVAALNRHFGHQWVNLGLNVLQTHLERTVPQVAALVNAIYEVEKISRYVQMTGPEKRQAAVSRLLAG